MNPWSSACAGNVQLWSYVSPPASSSEHWFETGVRAGVRIGPRSWMLIFARKLFTLAFVQKMRSGTRVESISYQQQIRAICESSLRRVTRGTSVNSRCIIRLTSACFATHPSHAIPEKQYAFSFRRDFKQVISYFILPLFLPKDGSHFHSALCCDSNRIS